MDFETLKNIWWLIATIATVLGTALGAGIGYAELKGRIKYGEQLHEAHTTRMDGMQKQIDANRHSLGALDEMKTDIKWIKQFLERIINKIDI